MAVRRRVRTPRVSCEEGCPASPSEIWGRHGGKVLKPGLQTNYLVRHELECQECGTLWETRSDRQIGYGSSFLYCTWHPVSARQQARYDRTKLRQAHPQAPFWTRAWRLLNS